MLGLTLINRRNLKPREPRIFPHPTPEEVRTCLIDEETGLDFETRGVQLSDDESEIVIVGWANSLGAFAAPMTKGAPFTDWMLGRLCRLPLVAHNTVFDGGFLQKSAGRWGNWVGCTYGMFRQLATEGFAGQEWSLEAGMRDVLGWPDSSKAELQVYLSENKMSKADIWKVPFEIAGPYCALDAEACYQLWQVFNGRM